jgi:3-isopropylmalate dehydrogenase
VGRALAPGAGGAAERRIAVLPGDGVGPEVCAEAVRVLAATGLPLRFQEAAIGGAALDAGEAALPAATRELCLAADAVLLGAVGGPRWRPGLAEAGLLALRSALGVYANLRPVRGEGADLLIVRELTGGLYFGQPRWRTHDEAVDTLRYTRAEIARLVRVGFAAARGRRRHVTSVDKANVLETSRLWRETVAEVAAEYPDVAVEHLLVDACALALVQSPQRFDVIVTENMFGDILSDEAAVLAGSIGMLASASLGDGPGLFEPVHGSAPDIAGQGIANPYGAILSAAMLLRHGLGEVAAAAAVERAVADAIADGVRTRDMAPPGADWATTAEVGTEVARRVTEVVGG